MHGKVASLNAAVAGSVLLLEAATQRGLPDAPPAPEPDETADEARSGCPAVEAPVGGAARRRASRGPARLQPRRRVVETAPAGELLPGAASPEPAKAVRKPRARKQTAEPPAEPAEPAKAVRKPRARKPRAKPSEPA